MNYVKFGECNVRSDFSFCLYFVSLKLSSIFVVNIYSVPVLKMYTEISI